MSDPVIEAVGRAKLLGTCGDGPEDFAEDAAREALKPIRELHRRDGDYCWSCDHSSWPCATARLIYTSDELSAQ